MLKATLFALSIVSFQSAWARGLILGDLTWMEAERALNSRSVIVIPLGAESKEHGPHLKLKNDFLIAEYFRNKILEREDVVVAPTINYHYFPGFLEFPGTTSLSFETSRDLVKDICKALARFGPKYFYILNTGISTLKPLKEAAEILAKDKIVLRYTNLEGMEKTLPKDMIKQEWGSHADEVETSMMLYIAPETVDMAKAVKTFDPDTGGAFTRDPKKKNGRYTPTGVWGDPTLATKAKGKIIVEAVLKIIVQDLDDLRTLANMARP